MQFGHSFSVQAPICDVFAIVAEVDRVVSCVPGAGRPVGEARIEIGLVERGSHTNVSI